MKNTINTLKDELSLLLASGDHKSIDAFFTNALSSYMPSCCSIDDEYIYLLNEAGSYYRGISNYEKSISFFNMLSNEMVRFDMNDTPAYATVLNNMAGSYRMNGQYEIAEQLFLQSIQLYEKTNDTDSYAYASALNNLSLCYRAMGKNDSALKYQQTAIHVIKQSEEPDYISLATSYTNLAGILIALNILDDAKATIDHSINLFAAAQATDNPSYIGAIHTLGFLQYQKGDYEAAEKNYREAMSLTESYFGKNADYVSSEKNLAYTLRKKGQLEEAICYMEDAVIHEKETFGEQHPHYIQTIKALEKMRAENNGTE